MRMWFGKRARAVQDYADKYGMHISRFEQWNDKLLALDKQQKLLLYKSGTRGEELVDLKKVGFCKIHKYTLGKKGTDAHKITRIALAFLAADNSLISMLTIFDLRFNEAEDLPQNLKTCKRWLKQLNRCIGFSMKQMRIS